MALKIVQEIGPGGIPRNLTDGQIRQKFHEAHAKGIELKYVQKNTRGEVYFLVPMTKEEIAAEKRRLAEDNAVRKAPHVSSPAAPPPAAAASSAGEAVVGSALGSEVMTQRVLALRTEGAKLFGLKVSVHDVELLNAGKLSTSVDGQKIELPEGLSVTVDDNLEINSISAGGVTLTRDGVLIKDIEIFGISITGSGDLKKAALNALGYLVEAVVDTPAGKSAVDLSRTTDGRPAR